MGMEEGSANGIDVGSADRVNDEEPFPSLGINVSLPTPEHCDNYVHAFIMLPCGNTFLQGKVISRKHDARGNPIGCANDNPLMDSRMYCVEFGGGNVSELTANVIAESMYARAMSTS
jgi:hypothetical protein